MLLDLASQRPVAARANPWCISGDGRTALDFARARVRARRCLASDASENGRDVSDAYGVRTPHLSSEAEPFLEIDRLLATDRRQYSARRVEAGSSSGHRWCISRASRWCDGWWCDTARQEDTWHPHRARGKSLGRMSGLIPVSDLDVWTTGSNHWAEIY